MLKIHHKPMLVEQPVLYPPGAVEWQIKVALIDKLRQLKFFVVDRFGHGVVGGSGQRQQPALA